MKSFDFFSLDYIYYPVSGIMWVWHKVFGSVLGPNNAWAWVLSVVFLVFTLRSLLFKPFMGQMNSQMKMQAVAPELKKLREKYKDDRTRLAEEMQKFNKEAGVNPLGGCLPALIQAPVFIGLFHVLKMFRPGQGENYFFGASDVASFVDAKLFGGAPLSAFMTMPSKSTPNQIGLEALEGIRSTVIAVGIPLTILAGIATFLTSRRSVARQQQMQNGQDAMPQAALMNKLMKYVFPLFVVVGGPFFPLAILFYWLSNNTWTFGQLYVAHRIQDKKLAEQSMVVEAARQEATFTKPLPGARPASKPAPGAKPVRPPNTGQRATATRTPGGRPTTAPKRPLVQPTAKTVGTSANGSGAGAGKRTVNANGTNGAVNATNSGAVNGSSSNGHSPADGTINGGARPSLSKHTGSTRVTPAADAGTDLPAGTLSDASKPKPASRKKKPGRR